MTLEEAIKQQTKSRLFVSLAIKPGTAGMRAYSKIFDHYNIDAEYVACECTDLAKDIALVRQHCAGASITMPYKQQVSEYIDVSYTAFTPVNTVLNDRGHLIGYNCDLLGLTDVLKSKIQGKSVKILGDGAMSKNAQVLCKEYAEFYKVYNRNNWVLRNTEYDVLINATSVGMMGSECPVEHPRAGLVVDCVIGDTELIRRASASGAECISGYELYLAQLKHQVRLYTGLDINNLKELLNDN